MNSFGHLLFDLRDDPQQQHPIHDEAIEARMINLLIRLMKENDAPADSIAVWVWMLSKNVTML